MSGSSGRLTGSLAHRYAIEREVGRGGMATVYLAQDLKHRRQVAIKVLHLGERDQALQWLECAYQERSTVLAYLRIDPRLRSLHDDPHFGALVRRIRGG
jgi:serine/threonine protein kinase